MKSSPLSGEENEMPVSVHIVWKCYVYQEDEEYVRNSCSVLKSNSRHSDLLRFYHSMYDTVEIPPGTQSWYFNRGPSHRKDSQPPW